MSSHDSGETIEPHKQSHRPIRLWIVAGMNIFIGILSVAMVVFLAASGRVPASLQLSPWAAILSSIGGVFLVVSSAGALYGSARAARFMLIAAAAYFGTIIVQNALLLMAVNPLEVPTQKLVASIFRNSLELWLNFWALRSEVTKQFFECRLRRFSETI